VIYLLLAKSRIGACTCDPEGGDYAHWCPSFYLWISEENDLAELMNPRLDCDGPSSDLLVSQQVMDAMPRRDKITKKNKFIRSFLRIKWICKFKGKISELQTPHSLKNTNGAKMQTRILDQIG